MAKKSQGFTGELIHFHVVRMRLTGSGNFESSFKSLDSIDSYTMPDITMQATTAREPTILGNFISQRGFYFGRTINIDETFVISKIYIYVRPVATSYPQ